MRGNKYAGMGQRTFRGGGMTDTHGEHYDALPRSRQPTRAEQMQADLASAEDGLVAARKGRTEADKELAAVRELLWWLLGTYAFEQSTVTKIRDLLPGRK